MKTTMSLQIRIPTHLWTLTQQRTPTQQWTPTQQRRLIVVKKKWGKGGDIDIVPIVPIIQQKPKRIPKCCVPLCTPPPESFFRRLPKCPPKNLITSTDQVRRTYATKKYKRKIWLQRFNLNERECPLHVVYCSSHPLEKTLVTINWKASDGVENTFETYLILPQDAYANNVLTREDHRKRILLEDVAPPKPKKKTRATVPPSVVKKKYADRWCTYVNCCVNSTHPNTFFTRVPPVPKNIPNDASSNQARLRYARVVAYRAEFLRRIGAEPNERRIGIRICNKHLVEKVTKQISYISKKGDICTTSVTFEVPSAYTAKSILNTHSAEKNRSNKGNAYNRFESNYLQESQTAAETQQHLDWAFVAYVAYTQNDHDAADLAQQSLPKPPPRKNPLYGIVEQPKKPVRMREKTIVQTYNHPNFVLMKSTGFRSMSSMLCFIIIVCNGDLKLMSKTMSSLTWLEEWHLYFERVYGRSTTRMVDCHFKYTICVCKCRTLFNAKLALVVASRKRWPMFVTLKEDELLRGNKWHATYIGRRIIMWDNTDVRLSTPSAGDLQRNTYSDYYNGNVGKGSVFIQLCGWLGTHELWEGAVTDTLQMQQQYTELYDAEDSSAKWISILDRGYKVVGECFAVGGQSALQPTFTHSSDPKFTANETQLTAAVAADRGANERAVRLSKLAKYIDDGYKQTVSLEQLCDVWPAWSYQVNFIYKPVL